MLEHVDKLYQIAHKEQRRVIGLMSGTSLDGLDIAMCIISGSGKNTKVDLEQFVTIPYDNDLKSEIKKVFSIRNIDLELLTLLNAKIGKIHGKLVNRALKSWHVNNAEVDIIASHGQTVYHAPKTLHRRPEYGNATLQLGDGDHVAVETGIITFSDFRQKHIAAGGEGAPLSLYGDYLLCSDESENRILLNIGGISNFTWLPSTHSKSHVPFATDVGPGNTVMDAYINLHFGKSYDKDATIAYQGNVNKILLDKLMDHDFFKQTLPKSIGPELFNLRYLSHALETIGGSLSHADVMATLNQWTAYAISKTILTQFHEESYTVYASGGGTHNPLLLENLKKLLPSVKIKTSDIIGIDPDAKEAVLFAILANECLAGHDSANVLSTQPWPSMGKISFY